MFKTYYSRIPGSRFGFPHNDKEINFVGGMYIAQTAEEEAELNKVIVSPGSIIFTKDTVNQVEKDQLKPSLPPTAGEVDAGIKAMGRVAPIRESGDTNTGKETPDLNITNAFREEASRQEAAADFDPAKAAELRQAAATRLSQSLATTKK